MGPHRPFISTSASVIFSLSRTSAKQLQPACTCRTVATAASPQAGPSNSHKGKQRASFQVGRQQQTQLEATPKKSSSRLRKINSRKAPRFNPPPAPVLPRIPTPQTDRTQVAKYLPLVTRERNFLISNLRTQLYLTESPKPEKLWDALVQVVQYPSHRPDLPKSHFPSSARADDIEGGTGYNTAEMGIKLSKEELIRAFTIFASVRPCTRTALTRLLVVAELIALHSGAILEPSTSPNELYGARDLEITALRGDGFGLRPPQWRALIQFAGLSYRSARSSHEASSAISIFHHWSNQNSEGRKSQFRPSVETYNVLLAVAARSKSWDLVRGIEERMAMEGIKGNLWTAGIRMGIEDRRGAHLEILWGMFEDTLLRMTSPQTSMEKSWVRPTVLWNSMLWQMAKRGFLDDALRMYEAMRSGEPVPIGQLAPDSRSTSASQRSQFFVFPPKPDKGTKMSLVQAFAYHGDFRGAMQLLVQMLEVGDEAKGGSGWTVESIPSISAFKPVFKAFVEFGSGPQTRSNFFGSIDLSNSNIPHTKPRSSPTKNSKLFSSLYASPSSKFDLSLWNVENLQKLFAAFLSIPARRAYASTPSLQMPANRNAPSPSHVFWILLAFHKLSGEDSRIVLEVWTSLLDKFGRKEDIDRPGKPAWYGWKVDQRVRNFVREHTLKLRAEQRPT
ncbi:hypothetical protein T439DRAFT_324574 [Meredithblackwellia eburnea MCA 4105]